MGAVSRRPLAQALDRWLAELAELLAIPSISAGARAGFRMSSGPRVGWRTSSPGRAARRSWSTGTDSPLVDGLDPGERRPGTAPTVLCYGHVDVQPPEPLAPLGVGAVRRDCPRRVAVRARRRRRQGPAVGAALRARATSPPRARCRSTSRFCCDGEEESRRLVDRRVPGGAPRRSGRLRDLRHADARRRDAGVHDRRTRHALPARRGAHRAPRPALRGLRRRRAERAARAAARARPAPVDEVELDERCGPA